MSVRTIETELDARGLRVGIVAARFNHPVTSRLVDGCSARLQALGCESVDLMWVAGAFEIPLAAQAAARTGSYDALVAIGAVIRGDTPHFDYVCQGVTDGVTRVGLETGVPVGFCVLTVDSVEQALERAAADGEPGGNKGAEAAEVVVEMARLLGALAGGAGG